MMNELKINVKRIAKLNTYTIGKLYLNGVYFCDTIEDKDRGLKQSMSSSEITKLKIKGQTAIPSGTYKVTLNVASPKYSNFTKYSWSKLCNGKVPRLINVPGFEGVLIHPGNTEKDTEGCLLVGENKVKGSVINSINTWKKLYKALQKYSEIILTIE